MVSFIRLVTVHPMLVHLTLGLLPLVVLAYAVAAWRRSERWSFAGDVALGLAALVTLATAGFGLVSNFVLDWPGGIGVWRWLHLGAGALVAVALVVLAIARWRRRRIPAGAGTFAVALGTAAVAAFAGWIGGEVLVYRAGMAVDGAADGALAPPIAHAAGAPRGVLEAMDRIRPRWARIETTLAHMVVDRPSPAGFAAVAASAASIAQLATVVARARDEVRQPVAGHERDRDADADADEPGHMAEMARDLGNAATAVQERARARDLPGTVRAAGMLEACCAHCHEHARWR